MSQSYPEFHALTERPRGLRGLFQGPPARPVLKRIARYGFALAKDSWAIGGRPNHMTTIGLWEWAGGPELVIAGVDLNVANALLGGLAVDFKAGELDPSDGVRQAGMIEGLDCVWRAVHPSQITVRNFGWAIWYRLHRGADLAGLEMRQLVWPDTDGRFPWEEGCDRWARTHQMHYYLPAGQERMIMPVEAHLPQIPITFPVIGLGVDPRRGRPPTAEVPWGYLTADDLTVVGPVALNQHYLDGMFLYDSAGRTWMIRGVYPLVAAGSGAAQLMFRAFGGGVSVHVNLDVIPADPMSFEDFKARLYTSMRANPEGLGEVATPAPAVRPSDAEDPRWAAVRAGLDACATVADMIYAFSLERTAI